MIGRFGTTDRFAEKYYDMSPYQYAALNPIRYIDVNGDSIWVNDNGQRYYYGYTKGDGYGFFDQSGKLYSGNSSSVKSVSSALAKLGLGKEGKALVGDLMNSTNNTEIVVRSGARNVADSGSGSYIIWDPGNTSGAPDQKGGTTRESFIGLAHEMAHVKDVWDGTINMGTWKTATNSQGTATNIPFAELYATHRENQIRAEFGLPLRVSYGINASGGVDPTTRIIDSKKGVSLYYLQNGTTNYTPLTKKQPRYQY